MFIVRYDVISERGCPCHEGSTQLGPRSIPFDDYSDAVAYATNLNTAKPFANGPDAVDLVAANIDIFTQQLVLIPHEDWNPVVKSVADDLERYCLYFCTEWIRSEPQTRKYRIHGVVCYDQDDFIDYPCRFVV